MIDRKFNAQAPGLLHEIGHFSLFCLSVFYTSPLDDPTFLRKHLFNSALELFGLVYSAISCRMTRILIPDPRLHRSGESAQKNFTVIQGYHRSDPVSVHAASSRDLSRPTCFCS